jgi:hypothetical protein
MTIRRPPCLRALLCLAALASLGYAAPATAAPPAPTTYPDSTGENAAAPDITTVSVSNDPAGLITFRVEVPNRPELTADTSAIVALDTDRNPATGNADYSGAEYLLYIDSRWGDLSYWNGATWDNSIPQSTLTYAYASGPTFRINASELGGVAAFSFWAAVGSGFETETPQIDWAPGSGAWTYELAVAPRLEPGRVALTPKRLRAGARLVAALPVAVTRGAVRGQLPDTATVTCTAAVAGRRLRGTGTAVGGVAECAWKVPRNARGQTLRGSITVTLDGVAVTRSFSVRIV